MTQSHFAGQPETSVIFGEAAIKAFLEQPSSLPLLFSMGSVKKYRFDTAAELKAFLYGLSEARGYLDNKVIPMQN